MLEQGLPRLVTGRPPNGLVASILHFCVATPCADRRPNLRVDVSESSDTVDREVTFELAATVVKSVQIYMNLRLSTNGAHSVLLSLVYINNYYYGRVQEPLTEFL